jgi:hypothetical protein
MGIFENRIFRFILFRQISQLYLSRHGFLYKLNHKVKYNNIHVNQIVNKKSKKK